MIITLQNLAPKINMSRDLLHVYLGHFTLTKHVTNSYERKHALAVILSEDFITDFISYLKKHRRKRRFNHERISLIQHKLEELLNA